jgi:hypothetical protein
MQIKIAVYYHDAHDRIRKSAASPHAIGAGKRINPIRLLKSRIGKDRNMRFGIRTLDEIDVKGKTVLCRVDMNQPVDRAKGTLKSTARIEACVPTIRELSDKGAKLVLMAHQGSDIEYKNFYTT